MKRLSIVIGALVAFAAFAFGASGQSGLSGFPSAPTFAGTVTFKGSAVSTKACAAGYTRMTPNLCLRDNPSAGTSLVRDTCTTIAAPDSAAKVVVVGVNTIAISNNAAPVTRVAQAFIATSATCATAWIASSAQTTEQVALAAGNALGQDFSLGLAPVSAGNFFLVFTDDAGNQGAATYRIMGYID